MRSASSIRPRRRSSAPRCPRRRSGRTRDRLQPRPTAAASFFSRASAYCLTRLRTAASSAPAGFDCGDVKNPIAHVMGYFVSILRERIANFEAPEARAGARGSQPAEATLVSGISINDLRKNLRDLNDHMDHECRSSAARYGVTLDASLITEIDPPPDVESAPAAINTAHNHVSSEVSLAHAGADQIVVNRVRQVTSAIRQDGANQVSIITNTAERTAAIEFAKAAAMRPQIVGAALNRISEDAEIEAALFEVLENQRLLEGKGRITLVPKGSELLTQLLAAGT